MKINTSSDHFLIKKSDFKDLFNIMKICLFLLFAFTFQLMATNTNAQDAIIELRSNSVTVSQLISEIEKQTDYLVVYSNREVNTSRTVSLKNKSDKVSEYLNQTFSGTDIGYDFEKNYIVLSKKAEETASILTNLTQTVQQQGKTVRGTVTDSNGEPVIGATIVVKGDATKGTVTDIDGNYSIPNIKDNDVLQITYVGMKAQEVNTSGRSTINVIMEADIELLDEVVVVGYGTMKKSDLTGSISQVKTEEINLYPSTNVMQSLSGKVTGVHVMQSTGAPGSSINILIRGANSIQGDNNPLYVIDGFPVNNPTILNNSDIESIEVLKDASATAIYGSRGANGVILVTTRKGKENKTSVNLDFSYSSQSLIKKLDIMNAPEYAKFINIQQLNDTGKEYFSENQISAMDEGTDWHGLIFRNAPLVSSSLNVSGGNEKTRFSISGSTFNQNGIIKGSDYNRYSILANIDHNFNEKFSVNLSNNLSKLVTERKDSGGGIRGGSLILGAINMPPTLSPYTENGEYTIVSRAYPFTAQDMVNPLNYLNEQSINTTANIALINTALTFKPIKEITLKISGGIENRDDRTDSYTTRKFYNSDGRASVGTNQFTSILNENTINYDNTFNEVHNLSILLGFTYQDFISKSLSGSGSGFLSDNFETFNLGAAEVPGIPGSGYSKSVLLSNLSRVNYNFNNKYYATASFRADGSSKFSSNNKWGYFPSFALAWRISEEIFMSSYPNITNLKLRTSWGNAGSQAIGPYVTLNRLYPGKVIFNDDYYSTFAPSSSLPGDLRWETTEQFDFGLDLAIKDRFNFTADYYIKNTEDLLNTVRLPSSSGYTSTIQNVGKIRNYGLEFGLETLLIDSEFKWNLSSNISFNRNKVVKLYNGEDILGGGAGIALRGNINILREGQPLGVFYGLLEEGYTEEGFIKYKDLNEDGKIDNDDRTYIGDPNPNFIYGVNSNMSWKNFQLNIFIQGTYGNDLMNIGQINYRYEYGFGTNMLRDVLYDNWSVNNPNAKYPKISYYTTYQISDRFVEDGSFLRLKNIQLAYNFSLRKNKKLINAIQLYVSGQNLLTISKYSGWDPEVNARGGTTYGVDDNVYPMSKSITFGTRLSF
jgi:TonB-linked SusC/RagA family outer membrane protein